MSHVFIATPCYSTMSPETAGSFAMLMATLASRGVPSTWAHERRDSNQARARNMLFHRFLESDAERMLGIDADQVFTPKDALDLLTQGGDAVVPVISRKVLGGGVVGHRLPNGEQVGQLVEMGRVGFGMFSLSRECVERLTSSRIEAGAVFRVDEGHMCGGQIVAEVVSQTLSEGRYLAVDDVFSDRWRALGGRLWQHTGVRIGHVGTHVFTPEES